MNVIKSYQVLSELYAGGPIESAVNNSLANTGTIITYIVTILVALTAIALPLTQQSLQWMEDKYGSESLVKYLNNNAPISTDSIVPKVLGFMAVMLVFYIVSKALPVFLQAFIVLCLVGYFIYVVMMYALYFSYVFKNLSSSTYIHEQMLNKVKNLNEVTVEEVAVLMDIEGSRLKNILELNSLSEGAAKLGYSLMHDETGRLVEHMKIYLAGLHKILNSLPKDAHQKKYIKVANLLSYFSFQLLGDSKYKISLNQLQDVALWVESERGDSYKPLLSARFLMELDYSKHKSNVNINELVDYIKLLIRLTKDESQKVVEELYERICCSSRHGRYQSRDDLCYFFHYKTNNNLWRSDLSDQLEKLLANKSNVITKNKLSVILESLPIDIDNASALVDEFLSTLWDVDYSCAIERLSYSFLFYFHSREDCLLALCDSINPLKSDVHNISDGILPNSIDAIFESLIGSQKLEHIEFWDTPKEKIIHSSAVVLVYEIIKCLYKGTKPNFNATSYDYTDLDYLIFVAGRLKIAVRDVVYMSAVSNFITIHYRTVDEVIKSTEELLNDALDGFGQHKIELEKRGSLDNEVVSNLELVYQKAFENNLILPIILRNIKLANKSMFTFKGGFPRTTFLKNTNTHIDFSSFGSTFREHLCRQFYIILHNRGMCLINSFPVTRSNIELVILTPGIFDYLSDNGFCFTNEEITWADGSKSNYFIVESRGYDSFYCATSNDVLFKFQIGKSSPYEFELIDDGIEIKTELRLFFTANV
ncbi:TPA: hypothetical protein ACX6SQ_000400 [Photobacterium damselae]